MAEIRNGLNLGGGTNKIKLMADLSSEAGKLDSVFEKLEKRSKNISDYFSKAKAAITGMGRGGNQPGGPLAGGGNDTSMTSGADIKPPALPGRVMQAGTPFNPNVPFPSGTPAMTGGQDIKPPPLPGGTPTASSGPVPVPKFEGGSWWSKVGSAALTTGALALSAANDMINPTDFITNDIARRRAGFFAGIGGNAGAAFGGKTIQNMMNQGTGVSPLDAANAVMAGNSQGLMTGLRNYSTIGGNAAAFSNLVPGAGLEGGMNATAALNQASSVNKLRMIGIKVRGDNGLMRSFKDIANDLWNMLNSQKLGGGKITAADLSLSLQSGNSLDSLLNQYFSGDPVLRQGIVAELYIKAAGVQDTKANLQKYGALPEIANSMGKANAAKYNLTNNATSSGIDGIIAANKIITDGANTFAGAVDKFGLVVSLLTAAQTLAAVPGAAQAGGALIKGGKGVVDAIKAARAAKDVATAATAAAEVGTTAAEVGTVAAEVGAGVTAGTVATTAAIVSAPLIMAVGLTQAGISDKTSYYRKLGINFNAMSKAGAFTNLDRTGRTSRIMNEDPATIKRLRKAFPLNPPAGGYPTKFDGSLVTDVRKYAEEGSPSIFDKNGKFIPGSIGGNDTNVISDLVGSSGGGGIGGSVDYQPLHGDENIPPLGHWNDNRKLNGKWSRHRGVDFVADDGTPIYAVKDGVVKESGKDTVYGHYILLQHDDGMETLYAHMPENSTYGTGASVKGGQKIGRTGHSGLVTGPHLHFGVLKGGLKGKDFDPMEYLTGGTDPGTGVDSGSGTSASASSSSPATAGPLSSGLSLFSKSQAASGKASSLFGNTSAAHGGNDSNVPSIGGSSSSRSGGYGNVTININVAKGSAIDEHTLAREVKRILQNEDQMRMAVSR